MRLEPSTLREVVAVTPSVHADTRGSFSETFRASMLAEAGLDRPFVQENLARTTKAGVVRGLHFQRAPHEQEKLVKVLAGAIFDVAVDIRPHSPTLGRWVGLTLSHDDPRQLFIPRGFAHGYLTLTDDVAVLYKTGAYYSPEAEGGLRFDDAALAIDWPPLASGAAAHPRDLAWPPFDQVISSLGRSQDADGHANRSEGWDPVPNG